MEDLKIKDRERVISRLEYLIDEAEKTNHSIQKELIKIRRDFVSEDYDQVLTEINNQLKSLATHYEYDFNMDATLNHIYSDIKNKLDDETNLAYYTDIKSNGGLIENGR